MCSILCLVPGDFTDGPGGAKEGQTVGHSCPPVFWTQPELHHGASLSPPPMGLTPHSQGALLISF